MFSKHLIWVSIIFNQKNLEVSRHGILLCNNHKNKIKFRMNLFCATKLTTFNDGNIGVCRYATDSIEITAILHAGLLEKQDYFSTRAKKTGSLGDCSISIMRE